MSDKVIGFTQSSYPAFYTASDEDYKNAYFRYVAAKMGQNFDVCK